VDKELPVFPWQALAQHMRSECWCARKCRAAQGTESSPQTVHLCSKRTFTICRILLACARAAVWGDAARRLGAVGRVNAHLQMKPRGSVTVDFSSTLAGFRSPCTMPSECRYSRPLTISSSVRHTDTYGHYDIEILRVLFKMSSTGRTADYPFGWSCGRVHGNQSSPCDRWPSRVSFVGSCNRCRLG